MNREEQIQLASPYGNGYQDSAFINGALWADAHPKEEDGIELWIARDEDGGLFLYRKKPTLCEFGQWDKVQGACVIHEYPHFGETCKIREVTFDNSPQKVKITLVKE